MVRIAVTGGIACGKSLVGCYLREAGVPVCECDDLSHELMRRGAGLYKDVVRRFGHEVVGPDGEIDRKTLGDRVFREETLRRALEKIVHPAVIRAWKRWLKDRERDADCEAAAVVVPLLYEIGAERGWNAVICVGANDEVRAQRMAARGLSRDEARLRMNAQWPLERKMVLSDYVIMNNGEKDPLKEQTQRVLRRILEK